MRTCSILFFFCLELDYHLKQDVDIMLFIEYWIALSGIRENIVRAVAKYWTSRQTSPIFCHSEYNIFTYPPKLGIQYYNYYFDTPQNLQFDIYLCNFWIGIT